MQGRKHWLWILLAAVVFIGIWQIGERGTLDRLTLPEALLDEPDLYVRDTQIQQFATDGQLAYELRAGEARIYEAAGLALLEEPRLTIYRPPEPPWQMRARHGRLDVSDLGAAEQRERLQLSDAVELYQREADGGFLRLRTNYLDIYPNQQYALSNQTVIIDSDAGRTTATGLLARLAPGLFLIGEVARIESAAFYEASGIEPREVPPKVPPESDPTTDTAREPGQYVPDTTEIIERVHTIVEPQQFQDDA
jgi:LPS export ABC transporter protein LptC